MTLSEKIGASIEAFVWGATTGAMAITPIGRAQHWLNTWTVVRIALEVIWE